MAGRATGGHPAKLGSPLPTLPRLCPGPDSKVRRARVAACRLDRRDPSMRTCGTSQADQGVPVRAGPGRVMLRHCSSVWSPYCTAVLPSGWAGPGWPPAERAKSRRLTARRTAIPPASTRATVESAIPTFEGHPSNLGNRSHSVPMPMSTIAKLTSLVDLALPGVRRGALSAATIPAGIRTHQRPTSDHSSTLTTPSRADTIYFPSSRYLRQVPLRASSSARGTVTAALERHALSRGAVHEHYGYAIARPYAGHTDTDTDTASAPTATFIRLSPPRPPRAVGRAARVRHRRSLGQAASCPACTPRR